MTFSWKRYMTLLVVTAAGTVPTFLIESWLQLPMIGPYYIVPLVFLVLICIFGLPWVTRMPSYWTLWKMWREKRTTHQ